MISNPLRARRRPRGRPTNKRDKKGRPVPVRADRAQRFFGLVPHSDFGERHAMSGVLLFPDRQWRSRVSQESKRCSRRTRWVQEDELRGEASAVGDVRENDRCGRGLVDIGYRESC